MDSVRKLAVIGLDCAAPELVFEKWRNELPCLKSLMENGAWGKLESVCPPITVPAWSCMMSGKDPGELGIYGFRNRKDYSYDGMSIADSRAVHERRVWDILSEAGKQCIVLSVPGTYPPKPIRGSLVTCFLTPNHDSDYTYPRALKQEIESRFGPYMMDVKGFRSENKEEILAQIYRMTEQHFALAKHLVTCQPWDFFMMVEMGVDRIHHAFWKFHDHTHRRFESGNRYEHVIRDYYRYVDRKIADLLPTLGDDVTLLVVSDHGAKAMNGGVCVNEWLMREGYLTLAEPVTVPTPIAKTQIDWSKTKVWGEGGYYARVFINVKNREPQGVISTAEYEPLRNELKAKFEAMVDDQGRPLGNKVFKPQDVYHAVKGIPPDLLVYFGDLRWRSVGSLGVGSVYSFQNDTGPDDANHAEHGIVIIREKNGTGGGVIQGAKIFDVSATILDRFGLRIPPDMHGRPLRAS